MCATYAIAAAIAFSYLSVFAVSCDDMNAGSSVSSLFDCSDTKPSRYALNSAVAVVIFSAVF